MRSARSSIAVFSIGIAMMWACVAQPYSARSYRNVDTSIVYATICHHGKRTIRIPAEEWADHKAHYDYRGPCRARGIPARTPPPEPKHTTTAYGNRKARKDWSEAEWERDRAGQTPTDSDGGEPAREENGAPD